MSPLALAGEFLQGEHAGDNNTIGTMDRDCAACHQPTISNLYALPVMASWTDSERWGRGVTLCTLFSAPPDCPSRLAGADADCITA